MAWCFSTSGSEATVMSTHPFDPRRCRYNSKCVIFKLIFGTDLLSVTFDIILKRKLHVLMLTNFHGLLRDLVGHFPWWRHQMETFSALLALCAGNSPVTGEFPLQRPMTRSFDVFFDLHLNKQLSKQSWSWWFETPSSSYIDTIHSERLLEDGLLLWSTLYQLMV